HRGTSTCWWGSPLWFYCWDGAPSPGSLAPPLLAGGEPSRSPSPYAANPSGAWTRSWRPARPAGLDDEGRGPQAAVIGLPAGARTRREGALPFPDISSLGPLPRRPPAAPENVVDRVDAARRVPSRSPRVPGRPHHARGGAPGVHRKGGAASWTPL